MRVDYNITHIVEAELLRVQSYQKTLPYKHTNLRVAENVGQNSLQLFPPLF